MKRIIKILLFIIPLTVIFLLLVLIKVQSESVQNEIPTEKDTTSQKFNYIFSKDVSIKDAQQFIYKNDDIIARLEIPSLFNILITKTDNNEYYLNHSIYKKKDEKGNEFMDYRVDKTSQQINIYGHNSKTYDLPFVKLEKFLDKDFFNQNKYILLQFHDERRIYEILSIKETKKDYTHMNINVEKENFINHINTLKKDSINERELSYNENSKILVLQTCSYNEKDSFYIITAIQIDTNY